MFEAEAEMALSLNPNDTDALADLGNMYSLTFARLQDGSDMAERAMRLSPHHPGFYRFALIFQNFFEGRYEEALTEIRKTDLFYWAAYLWRAVIHGQMGDVAAAQTYGEKLLALKPDFTVNWYLEHRRFHASLHEPFREGARKAGLPLA
jgi:tetratricopeptide (TPR) repeat protein